MAENTIACYAVLVALAYVWWQHRRVEKLEDDNTRLHNTVVGLAQGTIRAEVRGGIIQIHEEGDKKRWQR